MSDTTSYASSLSSCEKLKASASVKCRMTTVKEWIHRIRPARLIIVLILSIVYFLVLLAFSHITHALTLLVQCYHMVCNIIALSGSLVMVKVSTFMGFASQSDDLMGYSSSSSGARSSNHSINPEDTFESIQFKASQYNRHT